MFDPTAEPMPETDDISPVDIDDYDFPDSVRENLDETRLDIPGDLSMVYNNSFKSTGTNFAGPSNFRLKRYDIRKFFHKSRSSWPSGRRKYPCNPCIECIGALLDF